MQPEVIIVIAIIGFLLILTYLITVWDIKRNPYDYSSPEDKIINEMRRGRTTDYFNNPVVKELEKHRYKD